MPRPPAEAAPPPRLPPKLRRRATADAPRRRDHGASTQGPQIEAMLREQQLDKQGRAYATGRRKDAVARVWLKPGSGKIVINGREQEVYFARPTLRLIINQVFDVTDRKGQYDVDATVKGGGLSGQAGAVRHGIDRAHPLRAGAAHAVKREGFLTRDPRVVERKKYGRAKARRSFQFSKRKPARRRLPMPPARSSRAALNDRTDVTGLLPDGIAGGPQLPGRPSSAALGRGARNRFKPSTMSDGDYVLGTRERRGPAARASARVWRGAGARSVPNGRGSARPDGDRRRRRTWSVTADLAALLVPPAR